jgi:hypothetical protein
VEYRVRLVGIVMYLTAFILAIIALICIVDFTLVTEVSPILSAVLAPPLATIDFILTCIIAIVSVIATLTGESVSAITIATPTAIVYIAPIMSVSIRVLATLASVMAIYTY